MHAQLLSNFRDHAEVVCDPKSFASNSHAGPLACGLAGLMQDSSHPFAPPEPSRLPSPRTTSVNFVNKTDDEATEALIKWGIRSHENGESEITMEYDHVLAIYAQLAKDASVTPRTYQQVRRLQDLRRQWDNACVARRCL
jgi:hypothetical protein